jgi:hypothetical protein
MADPHAVEELKRQLRREVSLFCGRPAGCREPVRATLDELSKARWRGVLFGGALRSLLWSRRKRNRLGQPRDIDIVVSDVEINSLKDHFRQFPFRETRFGGLHFKRAAWEFDIWPLHRTWMFSWDARLSPTFDVLPQTTVFNLEAVAVELWPLPGQPRALFSGDDQFFHGILDEVLELNRPENPFPQLTVIRALLLASRIEYGLGPRLCEYIAKHGPEISGGELRELQMKHYGRTVAPEQLLRRWIERVDQAVNHGTPERLILPLGHQIPLFDFDDLTGDLRLLHGEPV